MEQKSIDNDIEKSSLAAEALEYFRSMECRTQLQLSERNSNLEKVNINVDYRAGAGKLIQINHRYGANFSTRNWSIRYYRCLAIFKAMARRSESTTTELKNES